MRRNTFACVLATLSLAVLAGPAAAVPTLKKVTPTFYQAGNGRLAAGLIVEASTSLPVLVLAGGFTITCTTGSLPQTAERRFTYTSFFGPNETLTIPEVVPSTYSIPGWSSIPAGTCGGQCVMQYKGEAKDETSLSVRIGNAGVGVTFTLIPAGEQMTGNAVLANICRAGRPQCCTPMCVIP
jgi:hypothetical protein